MRRDAKQEQATAATNLENAARFDGKNAFNRLLDPFTHFLRRNRFTRVAAIPPDEVERWLSSFSAVHLLVKLTPLRNMLVAPFLVGELGSTRLEFRNEISNQTFI